MNPSSSSLAPRRIALVMGVANHRSIAWACVQEFLTQQMDCIVTYHPRFHKHVERLVATTSAQAHGQDNDRGRILGQVSCQVESEIPEIFQTRIPELLSGEDDRRIDAIVHSIAFADMEHTATLGQASWSAYAQAQHISSYSLIETARCAFDASSPVLANTASLTALSYLGAVRALPPYHIMGPAKAALEANVRGLAAEYGCVRIDNNDKTGIPQDDIGTTTTRSLRVNAVSAGPVATLSSRGIAHFADWSHQVATTAPLRRHVMTQEIAAAVHFLATPASSGITGQTLYVDAGYSSVIPVMGN